MQTRPPKIITIDQFMPEHRSSPYGARGRDSQSSREVVHANSRPRDYARAHSVQRGTGTARALRPRVPAHRRWPQPDPDDAAADRPAGRVIDINDLAELDYIRRRHRRPEPFAIGALTRHGPPRVRCRRALPDLPRRRAGDCRPDRAQPRHHRWLPLPGRPGGGPVRGGAALDADLVMRSRSGSRTVPAGSSTTGLRDRLDRPRCSPRSGCRPARGGQRVPEGGAAGRRLGRGRGRRISGAGRQHGCRRRDRAGRPRGRPRLRPGRRRVSAGKGSPPRKRSPRPAARRSVQQSERRPERTRRLQEASGRRTHPAGVAPRRRPRAARQGGTDMRVTITVNGTDHSATSSRGCCSCTTCETPWDSPELTGAATRRNAAPAWPGWTRNR